MKESTIKAVVFDLDGVYFESGTENFMEALHAKYELSHDQISEVYLRSEQMQQYKRGEIDDETFWQFAIQAWNITATKTELVDLLIYGYSVRPEVEAYIDKLRTKGVKTAICTNNFPDRFENLKSKFNLDKHFDVIVTSYTTGVTKPSAEIFHILSQRLELEPSEIVMSDDKQANVDSLKQLGFEAFLYQGWDDFTKRLKALGIN